MAVKRLLNFTPQFFDSNGAPYTGARLFFYAAGSTTKQNTYTDSTGGTPNSNAMVCNASGYPTTSSTITEIWGTVGLTYKIGLAAPGSDDPPSAFLWTMDNVQCINDTTSAIDEWQDAQLSSIAYISGTSFSVSGDQTSDKLQIGRRLKFIVTAGTVYGRITTSTFAASATTVVLVMDGAQALDSGLSAVSASILRDNVLSRPERIATAAGTDTYTATVGAARLVVGDEYRVKIANTNTSTTPTLNLDSLGAKTIVRVDGSAVLVGELNGEHTFRWNGTNMIVLNSAGTVTATGTQTLTNKTLTAAVLGGTTDVSGGQLKFPATQSASADANTLDDYEEGTFTPSIGGTATYTTRSGIYVKIGRMVSLLVRLTINAIGTGNTGIITGAPFSSSTFFALHVGFFATSATNYTFVSAFISGTSIDIDAIAAAGATMTDPAIFFTNGTDVLIGGSYQV